MIHNNWTKSVSIERIAICCPAKRAYHGARDELLARFNEAGEFGNPVLYLLQSLKRDDFLNASRSKVEPDTKVQLTTDATFDFGSSQNGGGFHQITWP